jgi:hypothetical protein
MSVRLPERKYGAKGPFPTTGITAVSTPSH